VITVRWVRPGDIQKSANMRDEDYPTRKDALTAIRDAGKLSSIIRLGRLYIVTPSAKQ
jgi:hypothetical protein